MPSKSGLEVVELLVKNCELLKIPPTDTALINLLRMVWDVEEWAADLRRRTTNHQPTPVHHQGEK